MPTRSVGEVNGLLIAALSVGLILATLGLVTAVFGGLAAEDYRAVAVGLVTLVAGLALAVPAGLAADIPSAEPSNSSGHHGYGKF
jgi:hypothetical protein